MPPERPNKRPVPPDRDRQAHNVEGEACEDESARDRARSIIAARLTEGRDNRLAIGAERDGEAGDDEHQTRKPEPRGPAPAALIEGSVMSGRIARDDRENAQGAEESATSDDFAVRSLEDATAVEPEAASQIRARAIDRRFWCGRRLSARGARAGEPGQGRSRDNDNKMKASHHAMIVVRRTLRSLQAMFQKARGAAPSQLRFKGFKGDDYLRHRA